MDANQERRRIVVLDLWELRKTRKNAKGKIHEALVLRLVSDTQGSLSEPQGKTCETHLEPAFHAFPRVS